MDPKGYPDEQELAAIEKWPHNDLNACFDFIKSRWTYPDRWVESITVTELRERRRIEMSTGGWSGNEELIAAMRANKLLWMFTWHQSSRGGHFVFEVEKIL